MAEAMEIQFGWIGQLSSPSDNIVVAAGEYNISDSRELPNMIVMVFNRYHETVILLNESGNSQTIVLRFLNRQNNKSSYQFDLAGGDSMEIATDALLDSKADYTYTFCFGKPEKSVLETTILETNNSIIKMRDGEDVIYGTLAMTWEKDESQVFIRNLDYGKSINIVISKGSELIPVTIQARRVHNHRVE